MTTTLTMQGTGLADIQAALELERSRLEAEKDRQSDEYKMNTEKRAHEYMEKRSFLDARIDAIDALIGADETAMRMAAE